MGVGGILQTKHMRAMLCVEMRLMGVRCPASGLNEAFPLPTFMAPGWWWLRDCEGGLVPKGCVVQTGLRPRG